MVKVVNDLVQQTVKSSAQRVRQVGEIAITMGMDGWGWNTAVKTAIAKEKNTRNKRKMIKKRSHKNKKTKKNKEQPRENTK